MRAVDCRLLRAWLIAAATLLAASCGDDADGDGMAGNGGAGGDSRSGAGSGGRAGANAGRGGSGGSAGSPIGGASAGTGGSEAGTGGMDAEAGCGDGVIDDGEECDDGGDDSGDGCDDACALETGWECPEPDEACAPICGDGMAVGGEGCDDGNDEDDDYCPNDCSAAGSCGDGAVQSAAGEACDDGNTTTEACEYGQTSCTVCDDDCEQVAGVTSYCGDGTIDSANEDCDDSNAVTETCDYDDTSCTVCDASCDQVAGATTRCGDGTTDASNGEDCDDSNTTTEACDYGETSCTVCDATCQDLTGATSYCGDTDLDMDNGEECDDGDSDPLDGCDDCTVVPLPDCGNGTIDGGAGEVCDDGNEANFDGCNAACQIENGWTCPTPNMDCIETCGDGVTVGDEACDDDNAVDDDYCSNDCMTERSCGDSATQASAGEQCDDGNTTIEACAYGQMSCMVCNATCRQVAGATAYCGDGDTDSGNGEECDDGAATETCSAQCDLQRYCILQFSLTGTYQLTNAALGNAEYPQTGGTMRVRLPDNGSGAPGPGSAGILYYRMPTMFTISSPGVITIMTSLVTTAGTPTNECPLSTGTLSGTSATWGACPYGTNHCTTMWTPDNQQTDGPGCLPVQSMGNINCSGFCTVAGLTTGDNEIEDSWFQPQNTAQYNASFTTSLMNGLGGPTSCGTGDPGHPSNASYTNKLEVPERATARSWVTTAGTRSSITCGLLPATCP